MTAQTTMATASSSSASTTTAPAPVVTFDAAAINPQKHFGSTKTDGHNGANGNNANNGNNENSNGNSDENPTGDKQMPGTPVTVDSTAADSTATIRTSLTVDIPTPRSHKNRQFPQRIIGGTVGGKPDTLRISPRCVLPSPSRGRIDAQYARRLARPPVAPIPPSSSSSSSPSVTHNQHAHMGMIDNLRTQTPDSMNTRTDMDADMNMNAGNDMQMNVGTRMHPQMNRQDSAEILPPPTVNRHGKEFIFDANQASQPVGKFPRQHAPLVYSSAHIRLSSPTAYTRRSRFGFSRRSGRITSPSSVSSSSLVGLYSSQMATIDGSFSDRFIPSRVTSSLDVDLWGSRYERRSRSSNLADDSDSSYGNNANGGNSTNATNQQSNQTTGRNSNGGNTNGADPSTNTHDSSSNSSGNSSSGGGNNQYPQQTMHNVLLRSELLGENVPMYPSSMASAEGGRMRLNGSSQPLGVSVNQFRYNSARQMHQRGIFSASRRGPDSVLNSFNLTPVGSETSQRLMSVPQKRKRRIAKIPFKVLDAPALQDDFYLNLVDWSAQNVLAVGLGSCVYLWSACTSKVTKLCDLSQSEDIVTSVSWANRGNHLAVGTNRGEVQMWDCINCKKERTLTGHTNRVGTLAWNGPTLASGSRDRMIYLRDVRMQAPYTHRLNAHKQEVCGLRWSFDEPSFLASGGNDNQLHVIDSRNPTHTLHNFREHTAAVKAIAWSPHQHGLLASGGGTADRCIRFWNTLSGTSLNCVDTGSQVCNLAWSKNCNEIVSTHGYSLNQIVLWRYPNMSKVATLTGHTYRVLYLSMSPDGSTIVTGAGDETLRFWQVFPGPRSDGNDSDGGLLFPSTLGSVIR